MSEFSVELIDIITWESKFDQNKQTVEDFRKKFKILSSMILKQLDFKKAEIPDFDIFSPFSGIFL